MHTSTAVPQTELSPFKALITIFYEPGRTFAALENRSAAWLPLIVTIVSMCGLFFWFYSVVDFPWLQDRMLAAMPPEGRDAAKQGMSRGMMQIFTLVGMVVGLPLILTVQATYLLIVSSIRNRQFSFGKGFALATWASMPTVLLLPLGAMQILLASNGQLDMSELNPVSINQLFFQFPMGHKWGGLLDNLSIPVFWTATLLVIGYQRWAKVTRTSALLVVVGPYVVIYGGWLAFNLLSKSA